MTLQLPSGSLSLRWPSRPAQHRPALIILSSCWKRHDGDNLDRTSGIRMWLAENWKQ